MTKVRKHRFLAVGLAAGLLLAGATACGSSSSDDSSIKSLADLENKTIGVQTETTGATYARENKPDGAEIKEFSSTDDLFGALASGDIDAILQDLPVNAGRVAEDDTVAVVETFKTDEQYGFAVAKGSDLRAKLDKALDEVRSSGVYDELYAKYFPKDGADAGKGPEDASGSGSDTLTVCSDIPYAPMEFEGKGPRGLQYTGFDIELLDQMAGTMGAKLKVIDSDFDGILGNLSSGKCDVVGSSLTITDERKQEVDFTKPYFDADQSLLVQVG